MRGVWISAAVAALLAACGNGGSAVETRDREGEAQTVADAGAAPAASAEDGASDASAEAERGRPVWSEARGRTAEEGAQRSFERNGEAFGAATVDAFVDQAHAFVSNPPPGTETARRSNGDTLFYHAASNTFAVATSEGAPRTMFKPDEGAAYWAEQLERLERQGGGEG